MRPPEITEVRDTYALAERILKLTETLSDSVIVPTINELRYAGFHVLKAVTEEDSDVAGRHLFKAKDHCERAVYDAASSGLVEITGTIKRFQAQYRDIAIADVVRDIADIRDRVGQAEQLLADGESSIESLDVEKVVNLLMALQEDSSNLDRHAPDLDVKLRERTKETRRFVLIVAIPTALSILGLAVAIYL